MSRVSLSKLVRTVVDKWSLEYLQLAKMGDTEAMLTVAEIQFSANGFGQISHNPVQARRWIEFAASKGDLRAIAELKGLITQARLSREKMDQVRRYQIHNLENPKLGPTAVNEFDRITRTGKYAKEDVKLMPKTKGDQFSTAENILDAISERNSKLVEKQMELRKRSILQSTQAEPREITAEQVREASYAASLEAKQNAMELEKLKELGESGSPKVKSKSNFDPSKYVSVKKTTNSKTSIPSAAANAYINATSRDKIVKK